MPVVLLQSVCLSGFLDCAGLSIVTAHHCCRKQTEKTITDLVHLARIFVETPTTTVLTGSPVGKPPKGSVSHTRMAHCALVLPTKSRGVFTNSGSHSQNLETGAAVGDQV
jgi:hypothetical protein